MSQQTVLSTSETKAVSEVPTVPVEKRVFPKIVPPPQAAVEIVGVSKKTFGKFMNGFIARWQNTPPERKRTIALVGLSVLVSITMSLIATIIVRLVTRKPKVKAAK
jgi:hypothetical protein